MTNALCPIAPLLNVEPLEVGYQLPSAATVLACLAASKVEPQLRPDGSWAVRIMVDGHAITVIGAETGPATVITAAGRRLADIRGGKLLPGPVEPVRPGQAQLEEAKEQGWADAASFLRHHAGTETETEIEIKGAELLEELQAKRAESGNPSAAIFVARRGKS